MKRNRDALNQISMYDLLMLMNRNIKEYEEKCGFYPCVCIMDGFGFDDLYMRCEKWGVNCESCVMEFLNEKYDGGVVRMTNAEHIRQLPVYDLLCRMNDKSMPGFLCVLQMLDEKNRVRVRCDDFAKSTMKETCRACIAAWLNEPHEGGTNEQF